MIVPTQMITIESQGTIKLRINISSASKLLRNKSGEKWPSNRSSSEAVKRVTENCFQLLFCRKKISGRGGGPKSLLKSERNHTSEKPDCYKRGGTTHQDLDKTERRLGKEMMILSIWFTKVSQNRTCKKTISSSFKILQCQPFHMKNRNKKIMYLSRAVPIV